MTHKLPLRLTAAFLTLILKVATAADMPPLLPVGSDAYTMWDRWPYQRIGERAYMRSTYDRSGGNEAADASHFLYQLADDYNVTLDVRGTGVLYFVRTNKWHGSPWHYTVDGVDHMVQESSTADPLHPQPGSVFLPQQVFPYPLTWTWAETKGADLSWVPIGFTESLRLAYSRTFYGTGYYIYHQFVDGVLLSRPITTWDATSAPDPAVLKLIDSAGSDIAPHPGSGGVIENSGKVGLRPHVSKTVWVARGSPRMIRLLEFSVPRSDALALSDARLHITWDGRTEASIDAPISLFYGAGVLYNRGGREYLVKSLPMVVRYGSDRVYLRCYFPMPFFRSARIELRNTSTHTFRNIRWRVRHVSYRDPPNNVGYFHATFRDHSGSASQRGKDLTLLDTRRTEGGGDWSGQFVGTSFIFSDDADLTTLEGDPRFFFDDSQSPQAYGTGTEEWAGGGDYWGGENMTMAFAGHPVGAKSRAESRCPADNIESGYRFLLADLMPFGKNAVIRLEHGGENESVQHYKTVTYWYGLPAASLLETDRLDIGDKSSEATHNYVSPQSSAPYEITSRYEWGPDTLKGVEIYPATTDRGRITHTFSEFTLKIDRENLGVMLRRKLDYAFPNQRAAVFVKDINSPDAAWEPAGVWYLAGSNVSVFSMGSVHTTADAASGAGELGPTEHIVETSNRRFRDDEFLIPRKLTLGRSTIRVRIEFRPVDIPLFPGRPSGEQAWSEMRYTAYSFVMPHLQSK